MSVAEPQSPEIDLSDLSDLIQKFDVPGASIAVWHDGVLSEAAAGVVNLNTGVEATPDTLFQIGSITKLYTTVLILQLVEEGLLSLDEPIRTYLPDFKVSDAEATAKVTLRHLLTHTSGIDGDYFVDAGRGEDRIEKFVSQLGDLPNLSPLGHMFAYCNVGFVIAGRVIEKVTGLTWDKAMRTRIVKNIGTPSLLDPARTGYATSHRDWPSGNARQRPGGLAHCVSCALQRAGGLSAHGTRVRYRHFWAHLACRRACAQWTPPDFRRKYGPSHPPAQGLARPAALWTRSALALFSGTGAATTMTCSVMTARPLAKPHSCAFTPKVER